MTEASKPRRAQTDGRMDLRAGTGEIRNGKTGERKAQMKVLDVKNLWVQYHTEEGNYTAVSGFTLSVEEGETVGLVGESGCGKSTAVRSVMGIFAENARAEYDTLSLDNGVPVPGKNIAMIFQDSQNCLNPSVKIGRQMTETVRSRRKCSAKQARQRALELLDMVGIREPALRMRQYPFELSGGMRQRVVIAIALACEPRLIVADEPTTALDAAVQAQILALLKKLSKETKTALLLVSHDMGVIASLCTRVYVMRKGSIEESGSVEEIFYSPVEEYTKELLKEAGKKIFSGPALRGETLFRIEHLTKTYDTREGIRDISLELCKGEIFALAGESGSGKTTLARILCGLLPADSGSVTDCRIYSAEEAGKRGREKTDFPFLRSVGRKGKRKMSGWTGNVQMVFQDPYGSLNPCLRIGQALDEAIRKTEPVPARRRQRVADMLRQAGLDESVFGKYPRELSGGERQRVGIARALICKPDLLICDEAFSSLDASARTRLLELFFRLQKEQDLTCLFISHDMKTVARISGRMGVLYRGELVETGETRSVCRDPWHPYTKQLLTAAPEPDPLRAGRKKGLFIHEGTEETPGGCPFAPDCLYAMECCRREEPESYVFGERMVRCFLYSEKHTGKRDENYTMTSQI